VCVLIGNNDALKKPLVGAEYWTIHVICSVEMGSHVNIEPCSFENA
jgi:hypothetical protein